MCSMRNLVSFASFVVSFSLTFVVVSLLSFSFALSFSLVVVSSFLAFSSFSFSLSPSFDVVHVVVRAMS